MASIWHDITKHILKTTKKDAYVYLTVFLLLILLYSLMHDTISLTISDRPKDAPDGFVTAFLFIHFLAMCFGTLAFAYITQTAGHITRKAFFVLLLLGAHVLLFLLRIALEFARIRYRPERYV